MSTPTPRPPANQPAPTHPHLQSPGRSTVDPARPHLASRPLTEQERTSGKLAPDDTRFPSRPVTDEERRSGMVLMDDPAPSRLVSNDPSRPIVIVDEPKFPVVPSLRAVLPPLSSGSGAYGAPLSASELQNHVENHEARLMALEGTREDVASRKLTTDKALEAEMRDDKERAARRAAYAQARVDANKDFVTQQAAEKAATKQRVYEDASKVKAEETARLNAEARTRAEAEVRAENPARNERARMLAEAEKNPNAAERERLIAEINRTRYADELDPDKGERSPTAGDRGLATGERSPTTVDRTRPRSDLPRE